MVDALHNGAVTRNKIFKKVLDNYWDTLLGDNRRSFLLVFHEI